MPESATEETEYIKEVCGNGYLDAFVRYAHR